MTVKGTERLLNLLRAYGVSHFKTPEVEIRIGAPPLSSPDSLDAIGSPSPRVSETKAPATGAAIPPVQSEIPHHVNEVAALLKLGDNDLVDALFPEGAPPAEGGG